MDWFLYDNGLSHERLKREYLKRHSAQDLTVDLRLLQCLVFVQMVLTCSRFEKFERFQHRFDSSQINWYLTKIFKKSKN